MANPRRSTAVKQLSGTRRADREPRPDYIGALAELPPPPPTLPEAAHRHWRSVGEAAVGGSLLTRADLPLLELVALAMAAEVQAREALVRDGLTVASGSGGSKGHPGAQIAATARAQVMAGLKELGMTPRSRQHVDQAPVGRASSFARNGRRPSHGDPDGLYDEFVDDGNPWSELLKSPQ